MNLQPDPEPETDDDETATPSASTEPDSSVSRDTSGEATPDESNPAEDVAAPGADDDLPEWEPLTPELVEDEAIRGDFMLRWSVILLAVLMGWTIIQETSVLTHIKSGQAMSADGFLPSGRDTLSSSAQDRRWVNLPWLWDLTTAAVYGLFGGWGLTILKAVIAGLTFWLLSRISLPNLPTWWGSVCGALAVVAVFPSVTATPALVTLLGMACLLVILHRWVVQPNDSGLWLTIPLFILWNQLSDTGWIGILALMAFLAGHWWDLRTQTESYVDRQRSQAAKVLPVALLAMLVHPFLWETLLSPIALYQSEYPTLQAYANSDVPFVFQRLPIWASEYRTTLTYFNGAGLLLWMVTLCCFVLNASRLRFSHMALFVVMTVLASCGGRELAVASLVNAALATLNAQEWYLTSFRQSYSVETSELVFSRGGRATTVLALFALAFAMVGGHLTGADGRRVGMGFDPQLQQVIASYRNVVEDSFDDRPFNFRIDQGDILNWVGQRPFVDSRVRLFAGTSPSIVVEHLVVRSALRMSEDGTADPERRAIWQESLNRHQITHALPRLSGAAPDYRTFGDLSQSADWTLTKLGAATGAFYRNDIENADLAEYRQTHAAPSVVDSQLKSRDDSVIVTGSRPTWPRPPTVYEKYVYLPKPSVPNSLQLAMHYAAGIESRPAGMSAEQMVATTYAAVRNVHKGLVDAPNHRPAYHILGRSYEVLWDIERSLMARYGVTYAGFARYLQTISAYQNAIACDPGDAAAHHHLFRVYLQQQQADLAARHLERFREITGSLTPLNVADPNYATEQEQARQLLEQLTAALDGVQASLGEDLEAGADRILLANSLSDNGYPLTALSVLEEDLTVAAGDPSASLLHARLLLEVGRADEAYDRLLGLEPLAEEGHLIDWPTILAVAQVVAEDLSAALQTLKDERVRLGHSATTVMLQASILQSSGPTPGMGQTGHSDAILPVLKQMQLSHAFFQQLQPRVEANLLRQALIELELGHNAEAAQLLTNMLEENPTSSLRPVADFYLSLLTDGENLPELPSQEDLTREFVDLTAETEPAGDEDAKPPAAEPETPKANEEKPNEQKPNGTNDPEPIEDNQTPP